jgi:hypothetical protein
MKHINLKIKTKNNETEFVFGSSYHHHSINFWDEFIDYRSWNADDNIAFEMTIWMVDYIPKNIREITNIRDEYVKKCKKVKRKLLRNSNVSWVDLD